MSTRDDLIALILSKVPHSVDRRDDLPRHESKRFARRQVFHVDEQDAKHESAIQGIVLHQAAGAGSPDGLNRYHIGPNHISSTGAPRALYFAIIAEDGVLHIMNDLEDVTWSQGGGVNPVPGTRANFSFLAICLAGNFDGPSYKGKKRSPTGAQLKTLERTVTALEAILGLDRSQVYGHYHFGKENCPGKRVQKWIEERRASGMKLPKTNREWQQMLADLGYDLGSFGPNKDGVDGDWGGSSRTALLAFQKSNRAHDTGWRDVMTAVELATAHARWVAAGSPDGQCAP